MYIVGYDSDHLHQSRVVWVIILVQFWIFTIHAKCKLQQIIRSDTEEIYFSCQFSTDHDCCRSLDHDSNFNILIISSLFIFQLLLCLFKQGFCRCHFLHGCNHRKHNRYISKCRSSENRAKLWKEQFFFFHHNTYSTQPNRRICLFSKIYTFYHLVTAKICDSDNNTVGSHRLCCQFINLKELLFGRQFASHFHIQKFAPE